MKLAVRRLRLSFISVIILIAILALFPIINVPKNLILYAFLFFIYLSMANMWNLLTGYSGLISLCPAAFIGLAGYTLTIATWLGCAWYWGILLGGIVAALFAILISYPVFRMKGIYFAIATLIVPQILRFIFSLWKPVGEKVYGGGAGYIIKGIADVSQSQLYWISLVIGVGSIFLIRFILRSKLGLGLAAIRDNDASAASSGIDVLKLKVSSFAISAFLTGIAGAIYYVYSGYIEPVSGFGIQWLIAIMLATVIGGIATEEGPILGTIIYVFLSFLLARYSNISLLIQGVILVVIMSLAPKGIIGFTRNTRPYLSLLQFFTKH